MSDRSWSSRLAPLAIVAAVIAVALVDDAGAARPDGVLLADFGATAVIITVVSLLSNLFGWRRGPVDSTTFSALESIRATVTDLGRSFLRSIVDVGGKLAALAGTFIRFIQKTFGRLYELLGNIVARIVRILDRVFGPIIDFLYTLRAHLLKFYNKVLKPIIDTIEMIRSFLRVLSFFGFDWAKKLDGKLAELEQYILAPYEFLVSKLNEALNWINRIVTLDGFLQRVMLLNSLIRDVAYTNNLWWNSNNRPLSPAKRGQYNSPIGRKTVPQALSEARAYVDNGGGPDAGRIDEAWNDLRLRFERAGFS